MTETAPDHFNPLPPHGGRPAFEWFRHWGDLFQSTPSAWRETKDGWNVTYVQAISIHSLRMEGDRKCSSKSQSQLIFQSTPSAWRETVHYLSGHPEVLHFNPLPPHGGRPPPEPSLSAIQVFQSTPSAWRETLSSLMYTLYHEISIHSLRMEGDRQTLCCRSSHHHFNPLPPHGGRPGFIDLFQPFFDFNPLPPHGGRLAGVVQIVAYLGISIHSLRMEGDSKTAQESVFHFAYPCTILQKRMQKTTFCTRKNGFFRKKGEKFGAKPSASFCAPMIRTDTFPLNFSHRISGSSMSMVSFAPICSTFD